MAKELKFNEPCLQFFKNIDGEMYPTDDGGHNSIGQDITYPFYNFDGYPLKDTKIIAAPLYQQLVDWFRDEHEIRFKIEPTINSKVEIFIYTLGWKFIGSFINDNEAYNSAFKEAFKLIK